MLLEWTAAFVFLSDYSSELFRVFRDFFFLVFFFFFFFFFFLDLLGRFWAKLKKAEMTQIAAFACYLIFSLLFCEL